MKKLFFLGLFSASAVMTSTSVTAQAVEQGNVLVDLYYGFPNLYTSVFKTTYANSASAVDLKVKGMGPLGLRGEYLVSDKVGIGLDIGFNNSSVTYNEDGLDNNGKTVTYEYKFSTQKIGVMPTFNFHFLDNDKIDAYAVFGIGYGNRSYKFTSTDPNYTEASIKGIVPIASKIGVGMRYFFTDNIGINLCLGFGQGGVANAGLSFKF